MGISQLDNFQYESGIIRVWRAFRVGVGSREKALPMKSTQQVVGIRGLKLLVHQTPQKAS